MNRKVVDAAHEHAAKIKELRSLHRESTQLRREALRLSSNWAIRQTGQVDFLTTREEMELYCGALVAAVEKMKRML